MSISLTTSPLNASAQVQKAGGASSSSVAVDPNMFLKLLVAEIQNQDPTKPLGSAELVQQFSSFSQVQQSAETNSRLATMMEALAVGQSAAVVGRGLIDRDGVDLGVVASVRYSDQGLIAKMESGGEVLLGKGVTVRA